MKIASSGEGRNLCLVSGDGFLVFSFSVVFDALVSVDLLLICGLSPLCAKTSSFWFNVFSLRDVVPSLDFLC